MPRLKLLVSALALGLAGASATQAQEFSAVISFGDSLSDAGQYGASFTTNPDDVWTQILAQAYGYTQTPSNYGGLDYAYGGAPTSFTVSTVPFPLGCVPTSLPCKSVAQQIGTYLTTTGGQADPNALYTYWAGANDIFNYLGAAQLGLITGAQAQAFTGASAYTAVGELAALQAAGAQHIVVMNLPDIGLAPAFRGTAGQGSVTGLVFVYNTAFNNQLATLADGIIPINAYALVNEALADPAAFGFTNVTGTACNLAALPAPSSLYCVPAAYVSPNANETYLFADGVHPSGAAHALLARVVIATIQAPGQVSMAAELPLQVYDNHSNLINTQIFGMNRAQRSEDESNVYGQLQYNRQKFQDAPNTQEFNSHLVSASFGGDVRWMDNVSLGASVTFGGSSGDSNGSAIDAKEVLVSGYGVVNFGGGYLDLILSGGSSNFDIERSIVLGPTTRIEKGNTSARHLAGEIGGGFNFGNDNFTHGPFASVIWQKVDVNGYKEDSLDSTSMYFSDFQRESTVGRIGYRAQGRAGSLQPFARVAWAKESKDTASAVQAGSNTMNGHFTFDGFTPARDWIEADLGLNYSLNDNTDLSVSYRGRLNDNAQDMNSLAFGARWEFGGATAAPEPEPVSERVATTCADLDDDGDGVNNCDDKCPGSTAGGGVGPDGCPVPAAEPEPVMEAKPYRN